MPLGIRATSIAEGSAIESGDLSLEALWPPRTLLDGPAPADPNQSAIVLLARWHGFSMLLTADAEAEGVPLDPGPIDVLKVAHHGSDDAGLEALLDRSAPRLAVISVGADNPYGHPTPDTLADARRAPGAHASHRRGRRGGDRRHATWMVGGGRRLSGSASDERNVRHGTRARSSSGRKRRGGPNPSVASATSASDREGQP